MVEYRVTWMVSVDAEDEADAERKAHAVICGERKWFHAIPFPRFRSRLLRRPRAAPLTVPFVGSVGGTPKDTMLALYHGAFLAVERAVEATKKCSPRYFDYYVQGQDALPKALAEHDDRLQRLKSVREEYGLLWQYVYGQPVPGQPASAPSAKRTESAK